MKLNDRLAELRRERGITLRELRDRIEEQTGAKLSISYLSELERTEAMPSLETLARVAQGYNLSLADLLAPVDFFQPTSAAQYPSSLRTFLTEQGLNETEWARTLARIEFRGKRPETEDEWRAVYSVLKALIEPKLKG